MLRSAVLLIALIPLPLTLAVTPAAHGQAPIPPVPHQLPTATVTADHASAVPPGTLVKLDATPSVGDDFDWDADADETLFAVDTGKRVLYFASPTPGRYGFKFTAYGVVDGKVRIAKSKVYVVVDGRAPAPPAPAPPTPGPPAPAPTPTPPPAPSPPVVTGQLFATLVFDLDEPSTSRVRVSPIKDDLKALGCQWYVAPKGTAVANSFQSRHAITGLPVVYVTDATGNVLRTIPSPVNPSDVTNEVKKLRGIAIP